MNSRVNFVFGSGFGSSLAAQLGDSALCSIESTRPALSSALDSVMSKTAGGQACAMHHGWLDLP